jgi:hypothetical protein
LRRRRGAPTVAAGLARPGPRRDAPEPPRGELPGEAPLRAAPPSRRFPRVGAVAELHHLLGLGKEPPAAPRVPRERVLGFDPAAAAVRSAEGAGQARPVRGRGHAVRARLRRPRAVGQRARAAPRAVGASDAGPSLDDVYKVDAVRTEGSPGPGGAVAVSPARDVARARDIVELAPKVGARKVVQLIPALLERGNAPRGPHALATTAAAAAAAAFRLAPALVPRVGRADPLGRPSLAGRPRTRQRLSIVAETRHVGALMFAQAVCNLPILGGGEPEGGVGGGRGGALGGGLRARGAAFVGWRADAAKFLAGAQPDAGRTCQVYLREVIEVLCVVHSRLELLGLGGEVHRGYAFCRRWFQSLCIYIGSY